MARGFFAGSELISKPPVSMLPKCGACGLYKGCRSPKMKVSGRGEKRILIVGEFPGAQEDEEDLQFVGKAGTYLREALDDIDIDMRQDCWSTNALICRPPNNEIKDKRAIEYCRPNLLQTIEDLKPISIILLGGSAVQSYIGHVWKKAPGPITKWVGWSIPSQKPNVWITPTYHPSFLLRQHNNKVLHRNFKEHLRLGCMQDRLPWDNVPDYDSQIDIIFNPDEAAAILRKMAERGGAIAFDYENNCLKPETPGGDIICASACWRGKKTISYPWMGAAIQATFDLLNADNCHFIAANLKHEERWTMKAAGHPVRHWLWDTMLAAHVIDNRKGICSLKFQAFVALGAESYNDHIEQFLETVKGSKLNRVREEVSLRQLLLYCGTDTLLEYKLAEWQMDKLEVHPRPTWYINESSLHASNYP